MCKYGRIGVFFSPFFEQTVTFQKSWESWMFFSWETDRNMTQYRASVSSIAFSNLECSLRNRSKYDAILGSVSFIAFSRCRKEAMVELVFSLKNVVQICVELMFSLVTSLCTHRNMKYWCLVFSFQKSWVESWMFFEKSWVFFEKPIDRNMTQYWVVFLPLGILDVFFGKPIEI